MAVLFGSLSAISQNMRDFFCIYTARFSYILGGGRERWVTTGATDKLDVDGRSTLVLLTVDTDGRGHQGGRK
jgi:hypothetical protein